MIQIQTHLSILGSPSLVNVCGKWTRDAKMTNADFVKRCLIASALKDSYDEDRRTWTMRLSFGISAEIAEVVEDATSVMLPGFGEAFPELSGATEDGLDRFCAPSDGVSLALADAEAAEVDREDGRMC